jgi:thioredoxin-dependent peroxiredoxin
MLKVGDTAPAFTVQTHVGKEISLASLKGKKVVLWFYPKADTPGWTTEGRGFREQSAEFRTRNVEVLGISFDTVAENAAFAQKFNFPFPLLCDTSRAIGLAYGACDDAKAGYARRISYVIDEEGKILKAYDSVSPRSHPAEVLADLDA